MYKLIFQYFKITLMKYKQYYNLLNNDSGKQPMINLKSDFFCHGFYLDSTIKNVNYEQFRHIIVNIT